MKENIRRAIPEDTADIAEMIHARSPNSNAPPINPPSPKHKFSQRGYARLSWAVLNRDCDAIALYDGIGAEPQREWTTYRLSGRRLAELAGSP